MSEEFSGQTTRSGAASRRRLRRAGVPATWLSRTARRSALKSRPGLGTLPWTKRTEPAARRWAAGSPAPSAPQRGRPGATADPGTPWPGGGAVRRCVSSPAAQVQPDGRPASAGRGATRALPPTGRTAPAGLSAWLKASGPTGSRRRACGPRGPLLQHPGRAGRRQREGARRRGEHGRSRTDERAHARRGRGPRGCQGDPRQVADVDPRPATGREEEGEAGARPSRKPPRAPRRDRPGQAPGVAGKASATAELGDEAHHGGASGTARHRNSPADDGAGSGPRHRSGASTVSGRAPPPGGAGSIDPGPTPEAAAVNPLWRLRAVRGKTVVLAARRRPRAVVATTGGSRTVGARTRRARGVPRPTTAPRTPSRGCVSDADEPWPRSR